MRAEVAIAAPAVPGKPSAATWRGTAGSRDDAGDLFGESLPDGVDEPHGPVADYNYPSSGTTVTTNVYFGSKLIQSNGVAVTTDRQGSVRYAANGTRFSYLPYGLEQTTATPDGQIKFGTYLRDSSDQSQDYANQRYYNFWYGRFNTPDPAALKAVNRLNPLSWNRYAYVNGDPVNFTDPSGLCVIAGQTYADGTSPCPDITSVTVSAGGGGTDPGLIGGQTTASPKPASNGYAGYCDPYVDWTCTPGIDCFVGGSWVHWTGVLTCPDDKGTPIIEPSNPPASNPADKSTPTAPDQTFVWPKPDPSKQTGSYLQYLQCAMARFAADLDEFYVLPKVGVLYWGFSDPVKALVSAFTSVITDFERGRDAASYCSAVSGVYLNNRSAP